MTIDTTPRFFLPQLQAAQAQKEIVHNEALVLIDMILHACVQSATLLAPPPSPAAGQCWLIPDNATGEWAGRAGQIAGWTDGGWRYVAAQSGMVIWVAQTDEFFHFDGQLWHPGHARSDGLYVGGQRVVAARQGAVPNPAGGSVVDSECRAAVTQILQALRMHGLIAPSV